jgi:hypothetical protein
MLTEFLTIRCDILQFIEEGLLSSDCKRIRLSARRILINL